MTCGNHGKHKHNEHEGFTNNNLQANGASLNNANVVDNFWNSGGTAVVVAMIVVLVISLGISILLTVLGHKARVKCIGNSTYGFYSPLIITFLILMWLGNLVPPFTTVATFIGLIGTIVMIVLANDNCKK
jgi:hypothetical protein